MRLEGIKSFSRKSSQSGGCVEVTEDRVYAVVKINRAFGGVMDVFY